MSSTNVKKDIDKMKFKKSQIQSFVSKHVKAELFDVRDAHLTTEQIISFHDDTAAPAERKQTEAHIENCPLCCELFQAVETLEEAKPEENKVSEASLFVPGLFQRFKEWIAQKPFLPIAATAAAAVLLFFFLNREKPDLYSPLAKISPAPYLPTELRGEDVNAEEIFNKGMSLYLNKDFNAAVPLLERAVIESPENPQFNFYYGVTLLLNQMYEKSIEKLTDASVLESAYGDEANWYAAQAYLKMNQPEQAIKLLQKLAQPPGLLGEKAANLLQEIKAVRSER